ncbi:MAG: PIN domain-containing protein [Turicibacter sp.]|nr:PIN domain-containing protein [Turicibacter sp.]
MILVDTSVLIGWFNHADNPKTIFFDSIVEDDTWGISVMTLQEMLQGAKTSKEYNKLRIYLSDVDVYYLPQKLDFWLQSSLLYMNLRHFGITVRSIADTLIASTAIYYNLELLHNDRDFDFIAQHEPKLRNVAP